MPTTILAAARCFAVWVIIVANPANAQGIYIGPGGVQIDPSSPRDRPDYVPPPEHIQPHLPPAEDGRWNELRERMFELRSDCEDGDRRACVRLGIIIGENRERRAAWRREHPDLFWWER
jgi:hypothetical protein